MLRNAVENGKRIEDCKRPFSIMRNFARGAEFFFVLRFLGCMELEKTKRNFASRGKFRFVENGLNAGIGCQFACKVPQALP